MFENFQQYLKQYVPELTAKELALIRSVSVVRSVRRRHRFVREGEVCRHKLFVIRGLVRTYAVGEDGGEYVMRFTAENGWTTDPESYANQTPSKYFIEALEPTDVVLWSHDDFERLRAAIPAVNAFSESAIARNLNETQNRVLINISATAEQKYRYFQTAFPDVFRRVPLHMIASYLGVSRETLTRIRQGLAVAAKG